MKIAILADSHFGIRRNSSILLNYMQKFYEDIFFPSLEKNDVEAVIHVGDIFDSREAININTLHRAKEMFFDPLDKTGLLFFGIVGNHDCYYKDRNDVNSPKLALREYNLEIYERPKEIEIGGIKILLIPWIAADNRAESISAINTSKADVLLGHLEINGFQRTKGNLCDDGLEPRVFSRYKLTGSGHFHTKSQAGSIIYFGTPYQMTWEDAGSIKGFHILDTDDMSLEFIQNPYELFKPIVYDDSVEIPKVPTNLQDCYVKVIVDRKSKPFDYEQFIADIEQQLPYDLGIVDRSQVVIDASSLDDDDITVKDTESILVETAASIKDASVKIEDLSKELISLFREANSIK